MSTASEGGAWAEFLKVGLVQTGIDPCAWADGPVMSAEEEGAAIAEIRALTAAFEGVDVPDIVLLPELSVPRGWEPQLKRLAERLEAVVLAGLDYRLLPGRRVRNEALLVVPGTWRGRRIGRGTVVRRIGKTYPATVEKRLLEEANWTFQSDPAVWVLDAGRYGSFGVAICYDFLDLERAAMYRGRLQHLFVLSYNQDHASFNHVAEALARTVFANVVVCNCGHFGGSLAVSPYKRPELRTLYRHGGKSLSTVQTFGLPVRALVDHQRWEGGLEHFKGHPPGFPKPDIAT